MGTVNKPPYVLSETEVSNLIEPKEAGESEVSIKRIIAGVKKETNTIAAGLKKKTNVQESEVSIKRIMAELERENKIAIAGLKKMTDVQEFKASTKRIIAGLNMEINILKDRVKKGTENATCDARDWLKGVCSLLESKFWYTVSVVQSFLD